MNTELYKLAGLLAFIIAWLGMLTVIFTQGRDKKKSISMHAANSRQSFMLLAVLSPISMSLFMIYVVKWLAPTHDLSSVFVTLNIIALTGYILAAWVPAIEGKKGKIHDYLAYGASLLLIPITLLLANSSTIAPISRLISGLAVVIMLSILVVMYNTKRDLASYLYFQIAYFLAFDISLFAAGYLS